MMRRRLLFPKSETVQYIELLPEADGKIPKTKIAVSEGQHIKMEWDTTKLVSSSPTVLSVYNQINNFGDSAPLYPDAQSGYPIIATSFHASIYQGGNFEFDIVPVSGRIVNNLFIGYWQDSDSTDRRITADYLKIWIYN